jgi:hypothetical protein
MTPGFQCRDRPPRSSDPPAHAPCFGHTGAAATAHGAQIGHICTLKLVITGNAAAAPNGGSARGYHERLYRRNRDHYRAAAGLVVCLCIASAGLNFLFCRSSCASGRTVTILPM